MQIIDQAALITETDLGVQFAQAYLSENVGSIEYYHKNINNLDIYVPHHEKTCLRGFLPGLTQCGLYSNRRSMARGLKLWIKEVEGLFYLFSENKCADQLYGYRAAALHFYFRINKNHRFSHDAAHIYISVMHLKESKGDPDQTDSSGAVVYGTGQDSWLSLYFGH